ncbi:uncharacterized protein LOC113141620 [Mastacembelus armatus]|uniref:uncharacterized protein LOC113141620 n=1 Tax=Mastacembelus armatus TaxID=205130 RepID=UPI000E45C46C|nr:uncharacterized protein C16orf71 homolog [Mastacembelus armatus]
MDLNHSSFWNSILEKVQPHIRTIEFSSSSSENEETVFQRPGGLSLKIPKDVDSFSIEDTELEELLNHDAETCCSEVTCSLNMKLDDEEHVESSTAPQCGKHSNDDAEVDTCESDTVELDVSIKTNEDNTKSYEGFPVLSFARLDQWDLDNVLKNLTKDRLSLRQRAAELVETHANSDKDKSQAKLMERLVAFCKSQSSQSMSEPVESPNHIKQDSVWNKTSERMAAEMKLSHQERPTVFIDLRCPDPSIKPQRTSPNVSSVFKSPAKHTTHQAVPPAKNPNLDTHTQSRLAYREVTGKTMLLQKIREMNRNGNKYPNKYTHSPDSVLASKAEDIKDKPSQPAESLCSHDSQHLWEGKQSSALQSESREPKIGSPPAFQQSSTKELKQQGHQQRQKLKQRLQHEEQRQILKQLEIHRPTKSVYEKQPAAEGTDVLYDFEVTHLPSIRTLPEDIKSEGCMLLTVSLSSPGMIGGRAHGKRKHLYSAATKSHVYNTLVAWFLSLVGPDPHHDKDVDSVKVPFWVAGLQQLWTEDGLALHVLAVARHCYTPRKRDVDVHAPFYNHVCRFLSETSLSQIAHWLPELQILLAQQAFASPVHLPSSSLNCFIAAISNKKVIDRTFGFSPGFFWQTVETQECVCKKRETTQELHTEASFALACSDFFLHPLITHYTFHLAVDFGLDVCGLRLLYPTERFLSDSAGAIPVIQRDDETCQPVLALAVRGSYARSVLNDLNRSLHPLVLKKTDHTPVRPLHCNKTPFFYAPSLACEVHRELCLWFSGRFPEGITWDHNHPLNRVPPLGDGIMDSLLTLSSSSAFLCATAKADMLLVVSPVVHPCCYGKVLAVCEHRGFSLMGLQRLHLQSNGAAVLGLTNQQAKIFCSPPNVTVDQAPLERASQCLVLILRKENAMHHSVSLPAALMREFKAQSLLGNIHFRGDGVEALEPSSCFHTVPYSSNLQIFVRCMWTVPDPSGVILSHNKCPSSSNLEQVVILTLCGKDMSQGLSLLHRVLTEGHAEFQLLGLKWLPVLTRLQANEVSPYEVGELLFHSSVDKLMSSPALVCALRRMDAFASLRKLLPLDYPGNLSVLMSPTPEVAFRQASLFFEDETIFGPNICPPQNAPSQNCSTKEPQMRLTVCLFKPRVWNHSLDKILHKLQQSGLILVGMRAVTLDKNDATSLNLAENDPSDLEAHRKYLCCGPSLAVCLQGENAVKRLLDLLHQEHSSLWTDSYGSGSYEKATADVKRFFPDGLCCTETSTVRQEQILRMCLDALASVKREHICTLAPVAKQKLTPSMGSGPNGGSLIHSAHWQTTCLLIPLNAPPLSQVPAQLEMLGQLLRSGCHLVAGRMSTLDSKQSRHIAEMLNGSLSGTEKMTHLYMATCLIIALQGENVVTGFNLILNSIYKERSDLEKVGKVIIYPESEKEAKQLICFLFDAESCRAIAPLF